MPELNSTSEERRPDWVLLTILFYYRGRQLKDIPFMLEHLDNQEEYLLAARYVREVGMKSGISFVE
jgi:hypothetical protein